MTGSQQFSWQRLVQQSEGLLSVSSNRISKALAQVYLSSIE